GAIAGELRYFADRMGIPRAAIEGTQIPYDLIKKYATHGPPELVFDPHRKRSPLVLRSQITYFGFELGREEEPIEIFPPELAELARQKIAESLARFEARHPAVKRNRAAIEEIRDVYRRSGGNTPRLSLAELTALYAKMLESAQSVDDFRAAPLVIDPDTIVPAAVRKRWLALPGTTTVRDHDVPIEYDVEDGVGGVARLRLPEKMARTLHESELPTLDRPLRFAVHRGARGSLRGASLDELQELLERPWMPDEVERERAPERVRENGPPRRGERTRGGPPRGGGDKKRGGGGPGRRRRRSR
ncbi:MAG: helicase, family, partial [Gemmatimonadetes bacterium]|nr:helicase, family [Gemmatimonadota bacterium]